MNRGQTVKAMVVIRRPRDGAMLVSRHPGAPEASFHRPLGGHVEFGEHALATAHRELAEEINQRLTGVRLLGVLENIFEWAGIPSHEIVFIFAAAFADPGAYEIAEQPILDEAGDPARVIWRPAGAVTPPLYPNGLATLIEQSGA
jgi:ADP-ribose pyrophosphatase YjhB (NUDIX family)